MTSIVPLEQIKSLLPQLDLISLMELGFVAYSHGQSVVPPVGELQLDQGEVHIKYGFIRRQSHYVIKIASGFYGNADLGISTSGGCMLVFCQQTGKLDAILLDEGHLTDVRTAAAGALAAKHFAPRIVTRIGIVGTGIQARAQLEQLHSIVECQDVLIWGRSQTKLDQFVEDIRSDSRHLEPRFRLETTLDLADIQATCNLIVTTTPSTSPLLNSDAIQPGTHITAVGSDTPEKQELDSAILGQADCVVVDSLDQCRIRGEVSQALRAKQLEFDQVIELGNVVSGKAPGRTHDDQTTVVDLTGVAVQDIQIATAIYEAFQANAASG